MKRIILISCLSIISFAASIAQEVVFKVEMSADTLYYGNRLGIKYTVQNMQGDFEPPEFDGFQIVGGPNVTSQFNMINGTTSQSASYEYFLQPIETGEFIINPASLKQGDEIMYSDMISLVVIDNPERIRQDHRNYNVSKDVVTAKPSIKMTKEDSLKMKLKKIKSTKI